MITVLVCAGAGLLAACSSGTVGGTPSPETGSVPTSSSGAVSSSAGTVAVPKVQTPLPVTVLDGSPCDSALTTEQVTHFIGTPNVPERNDTFNAGPACSWSSSGPAGGGISVFYGTKLHNGLGYDYQVNKPEADRWEPANLQGYPAVALTLKGNDQSATGTCNVSVGIRDDLAFSVALTLGDNARKRGVDSCEGAKDVANTVLTNLKGRS
ncbi:MAG TPA: DUF3558 domain-containing protein [Amycolatopsis sp.]|nr:DUF3558 domain-containing protein [Amycolatopsis sp.]